VGVFVLTAAMLSCDGEGPTGPPPYKGVWEWVPTPKCLAPVKDIYFVSADDGWAVAGNQIWHWDGLKWAVDTKFVSADPRNDISIGSIWFNGPNDGWAGGGEIIPGNRSMSKLWHYERENWNEFAHPEVKGIGEFWFFAPENGYAFTADEALRYNGNKWEKTGFNSAAMTGLFFWNTRDGWATSMTGIWRWDGSTWGKVFDTSIDTILHCIGFAAPNRGWALGEPLPMSGSKTNAWRWNGVEWQRERAFTFTNADVLPFYDIQFLNANYGWAVGTGTWHWDGEKWTRYDKPWSGEDGKSFQCWTVFCLDENDVWAGGDRGNIIHFKGFGNK